MRILVVGATGLLGKEIVGLLSAEHDVIGASRKGSTLAVDISDKASIAAMYEHAAPLDAVVCVAGTARFAPLDTLADGDFAFSLANKLMGQVNLVRCGISSITPGGSITLTSGLLAQHPMPGSAAVSIVNAGVEAFARAAALELKGRLRVNVVSPGWVAETLQAMGRDPSGGVHAAVVAQAFRKCVVEDITGQVVSATHG
ncbi:short chain dehydrogenase [Burkholderia sp. Bp8963]|uniref:short chain dehydrogenase n=1 Tax=Burkholderia sp. Bp8963 TaxID=2184547 RepID=UPI000F5B2F1D|nr:short chain dehydrogenase [Burkholderia sp. Bp8963]RQS63635.1 short chain dehydrogenase [Burkholderia sp. Bp8963]